MSLLTLAIACGQAHDVPADQAPAPQTHQTEETAEVGPPGPRTGFLVTVMGEVSPYALTTVFVMPGESIPVALDGPPEGATLTASTGTTVQVGPSAWSWTAPQEPHTVARLLLAAPGAPHTATVQAVVLEPYTGEATFHGYRIGTYQRTRFRDNPRYAMPRGLVRLTPELEALPISPSFTLGQFKCKQASTADAWLIVQPRLVLKLERLVERWREAGIDVQHLHVMSAYRTPHYNRAIGNRTTYSQHLYGGAADVFVDNDRDGWMDDVDGDGMVTRSDAVLLASIVEDSLATPWYQPFIGGLGIYSPKPPHRGPFVHVDVRGTKARW